MSTVNSLITSWKKLMQEGLQEDSFAFDWTARAAELSRSTHQTTSAVLISKSNGVWAGDSASRALTILSNEMGMPVSVKSFIKDGEALAPNQKICEWSGDANSILAFERTFINLTAYACGIATQTQALVKTVAACGLKNPPRITGTRKTLPAYKDIAIQSTLIGGAYPHRFNLSGGLLIKENHVAAAGGIRAALENARKVAPHLMKLEIEVRNIDELKQAIAAGAEVMMLDNFATDQIRSAIAIKPAHAVFEVSGGINLENIAGYVIEGLDVISVGSITHSVKAVDLSLLVQ